VKQELVCEHPITNADPELKDAEHINDLLKVDWDDCCTFVRPRGE
jgi:hypothetical protein